MLKELEDTENISEDELPGVQVAKVPETEEVSDEELPGPKRAELPADTEVSALIFFLRMHGKPM